MNATIDSVAFRQGMRKLAGAVTIVSTGGSHGNGGFTATAVCSVSDAPPTLLVCVNRNNEHNLVIKGNGFFAVNILRENQEWLANRFAGFDGTKGEERLLAGDWTLHETGSPYLADGMVSFICQLKEVSEVATHSIMIAEVVDVIMTENTDGLLYFNGAYKGLKEAGQNL